MSKRKIRRKKGSSARRRAKDVVYMSATVPQLDPMTREVALLQASWEMSGEDASAWPEYARAHELMSPPRSPFMDPEEYLDELKPSIDLVNRALSEDSVELDPILRALGILGHTPHDRSLEALGSFSASRHPLAPVAGLALRECAGLYSAFRCPARAS